MYFTREDVEILAMTSYGQRGQDGVAVCNTISTNILLVYFIHFYKFKQNKICYAILSGYLVQIERFLIKIFYASLLKKFRKIIQIRNKQKAASLRCFHAKSPKIWFLQRKFVPLSNSRKVATHLARYLQIWKLKLFDVHNQDNIRKRIVWFSTESRYIKIE